MSGSRSEVTCDEVTGDNVVSFTAVLASDDHFDRLYRDGMALIHETSTYLDGDGRRLARTLSGSAAQVYAAESMRLTTRLVQLGNWLNLRRRMVSGITGRADAHIERRRMTIDGRTRASHCARLDELPAELRTLVERSFSLRDRILVCDRECFGAGDAQPTPEPLTGRV